VSHRSESGGALVGHRKGKQAYAQQFIERRGRTKFKRSLVVRFFKEEQWEWLSFRKCRSKQQCDLKRRVLASRFIESVRGFLFDPVEWTEFT
jgi:hypothetical protein